jgi:hypothetical protein
MAYTQDEVDLLIAQIGRLVGVLESVLDDTEAAGGLVVRAATIAAVRRALQHSRKRPEEPGRGRVTS